VREDEIIPFGKACKIIREEKGKTQGDIFRITGLERSYVSRFERGKIPYPRLETIVKIAAALDVSVEELIRKALDLKK